MAPEPHPTSKQVCWVSELTHLVFKSLSTNSTSSCTRIKKEQKKKKPVGSLVVWWVLCTYFLWANLSFRSGYEYWRPHLQRQISEVPLLYHILYRHSKAIKYVYEHNVLTADTGVQVVHHKGYTWTDVWCRAAISALSHLVREAPITLHVQHFRSVKTGNDATGCKGRFHYTAGTMQTMRSFQLTVLAPSRWAMT